MCIVLLVKKFSAVITGTLPWSKWNYTPCSQMNSHHSGVGLFLYNLPTCRVIFLASYQLFFFLSLVSQFLKKTKHGPWCAKARLDDEFMISPFLKRRREIRELEQNKKLKGETQMKLNEI